jgi:hypothetical protein
MNCFIVMFFLSLLSTNNLLPWIIPYSLDVSWNKGNRTYLLVGLHHTGPFGAFKDKQEFKNQTSNKLRIQGSDEIFPSYTFVPVNYLEAGALKKGGVEFVWVSEENILQEFKQKRGSDIKQQIHSGITNFFKTKGVACPVVSPSALYTSDDIRKT